MAMVVLVTCALVVSAFTKLVVPEDATDVVVPLSCVESECEIAMTGVEVGFLCSEGMVVDSVVEWQ